MVTSISSPPTLKVTSSVKDMDVVETKKTQAADQALDSLLTNSDMLQSLADQSSRFVPPTRGKVLATLWGLINTSGSTNIEKSDVELAIRGQGGSTIGLDALWAKLDPNKKGFLAPGDFATNEYLSSAVDANLADVQSQVEDVRLANDAKGTKTGTLFDFFGGGGGGLLDRFV